jgi:hypothetical protein
MATVAVADKLVGDFEWISSTKTWSGAESNCVLRGGNLASIHSTAEQAQAYEACGGVAPFDAAHGTQSWIGMTDTCGSLNTGAWTDGTANDYEQFPSSQPDGNCNGGENCVSVVPSYCSGPAGLCGSWNDNSCATNMAGYVCRYPARTHVTKTWTFDQCDGNDLDHLSLHSSDSSSRILSNGVLEFDTTSTSTPGIGIDKGYLTPTGIHTWRCRVMTSNGRGAALHGDGYYTDASHNGNQYWYYANDKYASSATRLTDGNVWKTLTGTRNFGYGGKDSANLLLNYQAPWASAMYVDWCQIFPGSPGGSGDPGAPSDSATSTSMPSETCTPPPPPAPVCTPTPPSSAATTSKLNFERPNGAKATLSFLEDGVFRLEGATCLEATLCNTCGISGGGSAVTSAEITAITDRLSDLEATSTHVVAFLSQTQGYTPL